LRGNRLTIGYFFEPEFWGKGYATEAAKLITGYAFELGAIQVIAECDKVNSNSERVMKRCGTQKLSPINPERHLYGVSRHDFQ
jgi:RimJ/RimL family protein N-acetyltransferase